MRIKFTISVLCVLIAGLLGTNALAQVSAEEAAKLGNELTPMGAEKAGNAAGTIPAWDGGISEPPPGFKVGDHHPDPFADEKPMFTITKDNMAQYADQLNEGQKNMLTNYPTFKMKIYPSHRTAAFPERIYEQTKKNATTVKLVEGGNGIIGGTGGYPFPMPQNGVEAIWNHVTRFRGSYTDRTFVFANPTRDGKYSMGKEHTQVWWRYMAEGMTDEKLNNSLLMFRQDLLAPPRDAGRVLLVHDTLDQEVEGRKAWTYNPGQRRVRRAPNIAFDTPGVGSDGMRTTDDYDMYNGSPGRYDWKLVGKKEMYIPYNSYPLHSDQLKYEEIIQPGHLNADYLRYELHRVWVVEATLKPEFRHIYKKRIFYIDEDSWHIAATTKYDNQDQLWRYSEGYLMNYYDVPVTWLTAEVHHDLLAGRYQVMYLDNEEKETFRFDKTINEQELTTNALRRAGRR